jgi:hypothetical protein
VRIIIHNLFIVLAFTFFSKSSFGQTVVPAANKHFALTADSLRLRPNTSFTLRKDDYVKNLAFFCRQEYKFEKVLHVPLRLRVGSLEQCNRLEGK